MCEVHLDDPCEVFIDRTVRARKRHTCDACGGPISPGHLYTRHFSIHESGVISEKMCRPCEYTMRSYAKLHGGVRWTPGDLGWALNECVIEEPESWWWERALSAMDRRKREAAK